MGTKWKLRPRCEGWRWVWWHRDGKQRVFACSAQRVRSLKNSKLQWRTRLLSGCSSNSAISRPRASELEPRPPTKRNKKVARWVGNPPSRTLLSSRPWKSSAPAVGAATKQKMIRPVLCSLAIAAISVAAASCAQPERRLATAKASPAGSAFDEIGRVTLHPGPPCTPQIMFDFRPTRSSRSIWLAAHMKETNLLTDAAHHRRSVHVSGVWRHGKEKMCDYVHVTRIEVVSRRSF